MENLFVKREVCPTCNGEKYILCCSCDAEEDCQTLVCPSCGGTGYRIVYNTPAIAGAACAAAGILTALFSIRQPVAVRDRSGKGDTDESSSHMADESEKRMSHLRRSGNDPLHL